ncbi:MAG: acyltransferase family protein [Ruminococcus sp.]|uniref:acyltransferase family protein n=1 Tax=Ruminococcus sp. TaxID=41978 RepID=UPI00399353AB
MNEVNTIPKKYSNIDGLRTFGCLAIVAWHIKANLNFNMAGLAERVIPSFDYLVFLFMLISGFGMCNGYYQKLKSGQYDLNKFYSKRYCKLLPFFTFLLIIGCMTEFNLQSIYESMMEMTLLFGLLPNNNLHVIGVAWTLGVIFAFYLIFPFIVFLLHDKKRAILSFLISLCVTFMCQEYFMTDYFVTDGFVMRHSLLYCLPYFLVGGLIYLFRDDISKIINKYYKVFLVICLILTVGYFFIPDKINEFDITVVKTILLYSTWLCLSLGEKNIVFSNKFTVFISGMSMEIYLAHMVVFRIVEKLHIPEIVGKTGLGYIVTYIVTLVFLVIGISLYKIIEKWIAGKFI